MNVLRDAFYIYIYIYSIDRVTDLVMLACGIDERGRSCQFFSSNLLPSYALSLYLGHGPPRVFQFNYFLLNASIISCEKSNANKTCICINERVKSV